MRMIAAALLLTAVAEGAVAQYVDKSLGICAPQYFADTVQIAYDDPKAVYGLAPHLNTFSVITEAAANGQCWTCLGNPLPVDMTGL